MGNVFDYLKYVPQTATAWSWHKIFKLIDTSKEFQVSNGSIINLWLDSWHLDIYMVFSMISMAIELYMMLRVKSMQSYEVLLKGKNWIGCLLARSESLIG